MERCVELAGFAALHPASQVAVIIMVGLAVLSFIWSQW